MAALKPEAKFKYLRFCVPIVLVLVFIFVFSQYNFLLDDFPRGKALVLPGRAITAGASICKSPIEKHFDPYAVQLAAIHAWDHVVNIHTKLAVLLDSGAFRYNNSYAPFDLLPPVGPPCATGLVRIGSAAWGNDNDKLVCGISSLKEEGCTIYSIGGHGEWGFEEGAVRDTACRIHTFDCTGDYPVPAHLQHRVSFHKVCLSAQAATSPEGNVYLPWDRLVATAGHSLPPTHVKMDIEGWEYAALTAILDGPPELMPWQISLELHWYTGGVGGPYWGKAPLPLLMRNGHHLDVGPTFQAKSYMPPGQDPPKYAYKTPGEMAAFGSLLFLKGGYLVVSREDNPWCKHCTEVVLARLLCP